MLSVPESRVVVTETQLRTLAEQLPTLEKVQAETPVETKGYKNIVNLPDWLTDHGIFVKSEKPYQSGRIYLLDTCPFSPAHKDGAYVIRFFNGAKYLFAVCTYGISPGKAMQHIENDLAACGGKLAGGFTVHMPHNGFGSAAFSGTRHEQMFNDWKKQREVIYAYIQAQKQGNIETGNLFASFILSGVFLKAIPVLLPLFTQVLLKGWNSLALVADEKCNGCGICQKICPVDNIAMIENRPAWSDHCELCFACLQWCPQEAIQAGRITVNVKRYHHPEVKIADMIQSRRKKAE